MNIVGSYPKTRLRRLRKSKWLRNLISETSISYNDLILPIFIREGKNKNESMIFHFKNYFFTNYKVFAIICYVFFEN